MVDIRLHYNEFHEQCAEKLVKPQGDVLCCAAGTGSQKLAVAKQQQAT